MDNPRKKYYKITEKTGSDDIYAILDEIDSDLDEELDNEMNDSDTEFVVEEDIDLRPEAATGLSNILTPNANIHKVSPPTIMNFVHALKKKQQSGSGHESSSQARRSNASFNKMYYCISIVTQLHLMFLKKLLI